MFNPHPTIRSFPITASQSCYVVDDALLDPEALRDHAVAHRAQFSMTAKNAYPGTQLTMPESFSTRLDDFFRLHIRARIGARRTLRMYSRLAMVTLPSEELYPGQCFCHRDMIGFAPGQKIGASVLYLFEDPALGGTSFYVPKRPQPELTALSRDAIALEPDDFFARHGIERNYMSASNAYYRQVLSVPAKWNRMIFYDGGVLHSGDILAPGRLSDDPMHGRLTLNGFFVCSPALA